MSTLHHTTPLLGSTSLSLETFSSFFEFPTSFSILSCLVLHQFGQRRSNMSKRMGTTGLARRLTTSLLGGFCLYPTIRHWDSVHCTSFLSCFLCYVVDGGERGRGESRRFLTPSQPAWIAALSFFQLLGEVLGGCMHSIIDNGD